jgi:hypothetical protein
MKNRKSTRRVEVLSCTTNFSDRLLAMLFYHLRTGFSNGSFLFGCTRQKKKKKKSLYFVFITGKNRPLNSTAGGCPEILRVFLFKFPSFSSLLLQINYIVVDNANQHEDTALNSGMNCLIAFYNITSMSNHFYSLRYKTY